MREVVRLKTHTLPYPWHGLRRGNTEQIGFGIESPDRKLEKRSFPTFATPVTQVSSVPLPAVMLSSRNATVRNMWRARRFFTQVVPSPMEKKTIYALSTPPGRGGIGVIRVSGPDALDVYSQMVRVGAGTGVKGKQKEVIPEPWKMRRCSIVHPESQEVLDEGMAVFFRGSSLMFGRSRVLP